MGADPVEALRPGDHEEAKAGLRRKMGNGGWAEGRRGGSTGTGAQTHLQDEDEVVRRLVASVQVMTDVVLVVLVKLELLDDVWVLEQPQQDLL